MVYNFYIWRKFCFYIFIFVIFWFFIIGKNKIYFIYVKIFFVNELYLKMIDMFIIVFKKGLNDV